MPCLPRVKRIFWQDRLAFWQSELIAIDTALMEATVSVKEYRLNTGEGMQQTEYRDLDELKKKMSYAEAKIDWILNKLNGWGVVSMNLRRKNGIAS